MIKRALLTSLLIFSLVGLIRAQEISSNAAAMAAIHNLQERETQAIKNKDAAALCSLLADGWDYTNQMGHMMRKAQWCSEMTNGVLFFRNIHQEDVSYHFFRNTVIETGRDTSTMVYHRKVSFGPRRFSITYVKLGNDWKICAYAVSLITNQQ